MDYEFPDDENGQALKKMKQGGDDFSIKREINFSVIFFERDEAERFCVAMAKKDYKILIEYNDHRDPAVWDVTLSRIMSPNHHDITQIENEIDLIAGPLNGFNDGWGCFRQ